MKKFKVLILALSLGFGALFCASFFGTKNVAFAEAQNATPTEISTVDGFKNITGSGNFKLAADITLSFDGEDVNGNGQLDEGEDVNGNGNLDGPFSQIEEFSGTLDGNGHIIYAKLSAPIFKKLSGATIKNIRIACAGEDTNGNGTLDYGEDVNDNDKLDTTLNFSAGLGSEQNIGILAGEVENSTILGIYINGAELNVSDISTNCNVGLVAGKISGGTLIQNCLIDNSKIYAVFSNSIADTFNFGGLVGLMENSKIANCIVNFNKLDEGGNQESIVFKSNFTKQISFGGLVGFVKGEALKNHIYNNVVILDSSYISFPIAFETKYVGAVAGTLYNAPYFTNICGFVTNYSGLPFGYKFAEQSYSGINVLSLDQIDHSTFKNSDLWYDSLTYAWDEWETWLFAVNAKLPTLQYFNAYSINFDSLESKNSLNSQVTPQGDILQVKINGEDATSVSEIKYGSTVSISLNLIDEDAVGNPNYYNKFFKITGLMLDNNLVYTNAGTEEQNNVSLKEEGNVYSYTISNFNANNAGTYSAIIDRNIFKLNVSVLPYMVSADHEEIPAKFKTSINSNSLESDVIELQYGDEIIFYTSVTNIDYSQNANWHVYKMPTKTVDGKATFEQSDFMPNSPLWESSNQLKINFTENCQLFGEGLFNFDDYVEVEYPEDLNGNNQLDDGEDLNGNEVLDQENKSNFNLYLEYTTQVKQVNFVLQYKNGEKIFEPIARILINGSDDRIVWNEEEECFVAKLPFGENDITYTIKLDQYANNYDFSGWFEGILDITNQEDNRLCEIVITKDTDELTIFCEFETPENTVVNLIWLWILLGIVGVGILVLIIVLIKRRGGRSKAYRKYYY